MTIVNDDKPAIRFWGDIPYMYGTPWSGKTELSAIVFLERAETNAICAV